MFVFCLERRYLLFVLFWGFCLFLYNCYWHYANLLLTVGPDATDSAVVGGGGRGGGGRGGSSAHTVKELISQSSTRTLIPISNRLGEVAAKNLNWAWAVLIGMLPHIALSHNWFVPESDRCWTESGRWIGKQSRHYTWLRAWKSRSVERLDELCEQGMKDRSEHSRLDCKFCFSGTSLLRQFYLLPHWDRSCRSHFQFHRVTVY